MRRRTVRKNVKPKENICSKLGPYGTLVAIGAYFKLICKAGSPIAKTTSVDDIGTHWNGVPDFQNDCIMVHEKRGALTDNPEIITHRIERHRFANLRM